MSADESGVVPLFSVEDPKRVRVRVIRSHPGRWGAPAIAACVALPITTVVADEEWVDVLDDLDRLIRRWQGTRRYLGRSATR